MKEKFGSLRVFFRIENRESEAAESANRWIEEAYEKSRSTCEHCGSLGISEWRKQGGLLTLCEPCAAENDRK